MFIKVHSVTIVHEESAETMCRKNADANWDTKFNYVCNRLKSTIINVLFETTIRNLRIDGTILTRFCEW